MKLIIFSDKSKGLKVGKFTVIKLYKKKTMNSWLCTASDSISFLN